MAARRFRYSHLRCGSSGRGRQRYRLGQRSRTKFQRRGSNTVLIKLKNAIRKSPQDPAIHVNIAKVYLRLGDPASAEREARTARDLKGDEADYLPVLIDALLPQKKFYYLRKNSKIFTI